jgi:hypothetical protein
VYTKTETSWNKLEKSNQSTKVIAFGQVVPSLDAIALCFAMLSSRGVQEAEGTAERAMRASAEILQLSASQLPKGP